MFIKLGRRICGLWLVYGVLGGKDEGVNMFFLMEIILLVVVEMMMVVGVSLLFIIVCEEVRIVILLFLMVGVVVLFVLKVCGVDVLVVKGVILFGCLYVSDVGRY